MYDHPYKHRVLFLHWSVPQRLNRGLRGRVIIAFSGNCCVLAMKMLDMVQRPLSLPSGQNKCLIWWVWQQSRANVNFLRLHKLNILWQVNRRLSHIHNPQEMQSFVNLQFQNYFFNIKMEENLPRCESWLTIPSPTPPPKAPKWKLPSHVQLLLISWSI